MWESTKTWNFRKSHHGSRLKRGTRAIVKWFCVAGAHFMIYFFGKPAAKHAFVKWVAFLKEIL